MNIFNIKAGKAKIAILLLSLSPFTHIKSTEWVTKGVTKGFYSMARSVVRGFAQAGKDELKKELDHLGVDISDPKGDIKDNIKDIIGDETSDFKSDFKKGIREVEKVRVHVDDFKKKADQTLAKANILITLITCFICMLILQKIYQWSISIAQYLKEKRKKRILKRRRVDIDEPRRRSRIPNNAEVNA